MKNYFIFSIIIFLTFLLNGCSNKNLSIVEKKQKTELLTNNQEIEEDDELSEFQEEMSSGEEEIYDPLNSYNRIMTNFNDKLMIYILSPVAKGYKVITTKDIRISVNNFFHNLAYPIRVINNLLQGKFKNSSEETGRFLINSTIGIFGFFDVAKKHFNLEPHNEDFGQTLGYWGVGSGVHIVLPLFGPSNLRDSISLYPEMLASPTSYIDDRSYNLVSNPNEGIGLKALDIVNTTAINDGLYEKMKADAVDLYPYLRDMYEQRREKLIKE
jgi:phospholipid-binding lipoprotein MlaA